MTTDPVTRSVEIPEAAVDYLGRLWWKQYDTESPYQHAQSVAKTREAIEGLLPYLAPVGDGGLREALTDLLAAVEASPCTFWACEGPDSEPQDMITCNPCRAVHEARKVLAAHPAAPAVPQPATLPTCVNCESETFECSACGSLVEPWGSAVPQPVDREALKRLAEKWATMDTPGLSAPSNQEWATGVDQGYSNAAAELLAVLAGEQEQVEP